MSSPKEDRIHDLKDFAEFFQAVEREGFEYVVIGGCAVGAYSHLMGEACLTTDLDILASAETLNSVLAWARASKNIGITKTPKPRSLQVAVLFFGGREINILTRSEGLPPAPQALQSARIFKIEALGQLGIPIADPFDLLRNKLAIRRPKDEPHIELLRRFLDEEVVACFSQNASPRERLSSARRLLRTLNTQTLADNLIERLMPLAATAVDFRFLVNHAPSKKLLAKLLDAAPTESREQLIKISSHRDWSEDD